MRTATLGILGLALAAGGGGTAIAVAGSGGGASAAATKDVKTATTSLGTVLVNSKGITLYRLTAETRSHFICTGSCTKIWFPLHPRRGHNPTGTVGHLSTVKRPDGTKQIAYKGYPLYRFSGDSQRGDVKGQGFKDVGTWTVIKVKPPSTSTQTQTTTTQSTTGYGGYGY